jgi:hypothetical protein
MVRWLIAERRGKSCASFDVQVSCGALARILSIAISGVMSRLFLSHVQRNLRRSAFWHNAEILLITENCPSTAIELPSHKRLRELDYNELRGLEIITSTVQKITLMQEVKCKKLSLNKYKISMCQDKNWYNNLTKLIKKEKRNATASYFRKFCEKFHIKESIQNRK